MIACPGCGGRNEPEAKTCEWCGRPFVAPPRRIGGPIVMLAAGATVIVAVLVAAAVLITSLVAAFSPRPGPPSTIAQPAELPVTRPPLDEEPPSTTEIVAGQEFVRVANTAGAGAFIREEPRSAARGIVAHTDRTVLKVIGTDVSAEGRPWRNVEDQRGNRGWTPAEFLVPSDVGF